MTDIRGCTIPDHWLSEVCVFMVLETTFTL